MQHNNSHKLETHRLVLEPVLESELDTLYTIFANPYVRKYLCDGEIFSLQQVKEMIEQSQKYFTENGFGIWLIRIKGESEIVGFTGLWYFFNEEQPQLIYALLPEATKKGYATEAASKVLAYCFDELGYKYVVASCDRPNLESQKVAKRLGMRKTAEEMIDRKPVVFFSLERTNFRNALDF